MALNVVTAAIGGSARGEAVAVLGLTFRTDTDEIRDAPSLISGHKDGGVQGMACDPDGIEQAKPPLERVRHAEDA